MGRIHKWSKWKKGRKVNSSNSLLQKSRSGRFVRLALKGNGNDGRSVKGSNVNLIGWVKHVTSLLLGHTRNKPTVGLM